MDTEPYWSTRQHSGRLGSQAGLHSFPVCSDGPGFGEVSDPEDRATGVPYPLLSWSTFSHTPHPYRRGQSAVPLETRLVQKRVHHCCSAENGPLSSSGQLPTPNWTTTVSIVCTLRRRWRDSTASIPVLSDSHASTHLHQLHRLYRPTMHDELPGDDWGGDTSPRPGMRERELYTAPCATSNSWAQIMYTLLVNFYVNVGVTVVELFVLVKLTLLLKCWWW